MSPVTAQPLATIGDENASRAPALLRQEGVRAMPHRIKVRYRSRPPKPWKWEIYLDDRLITASNESYATQDEAHSAGRTALDDMTSGHTASHEIRDGRLVPKG